MMLLSPISYDGGTVDYTPGAMRNATKADWRAMYYTPASMGTRCHQLAAYIVHDSPLPCCVMRLPTI